MSTHHSMVSKAVDIVAKSVMDLDSNALTRLTKALNEEATIILKELENNGQNVNSEILAARLDGMLMRIKYEILNQVHNSPNEFPIFNVSHNPSAPYPNPINHLYDKRYKDAYSTFINQSQTLENDVPPTSSGILPPSPKIVNSANANTPFNPNLSLPHQHQQPMPVYNYNDNRPNNIFMQNHYPSHQQKPQYLLGTMPHSHENINIGFNNLRQSSTVDDIDYRQFHHHKHRIPSNINDRSFELPYNHHRKDRKEKIKVYSDDDPNTILKIRDGQDYSRKVYVSPEANIGANTVFDLMAAVDSRRKTDTPSNADRVIIIDRNKPKDKMRLFGIQRESPKTPKFYPNNLSLPATMHKVGRNFQIPSGFYYPVLHKQLFLKIHRNKYFEVTPKEVQFDGFEINETHSKEIRIINRSAEVMRVDIIPPLTKYFSINYKKPLRLVPGFSIDVTVHFKPDSWRYFNDAIRIHTPDKTNLLVPLHGYPIVFLTGLPEYYQFPNTAVGNVVTKTFSFQSAAPVEFEYQIDILSQDPALSIEPMEGIIDSSNVTSITVTYAPTSFCTSRLCVQINVSQFHSQPFLCTFMGKCLPGLAREQVKKTLNISGQFSTDNINLVSSKKQSSINQKSKTTRGFQSSAIVHESIKTEIERDGLRIPSQLNSTWAVSKVLLQKKGKIALKDLRRLNDLMDNQTTGMTRQKKETIFLQDVNRIEEEEQRNKIRWQKKLGFDPISIDDRNDILNSRNISWAEYKIRIGNPIPEDEYNRDETKYSQQRTIRPLGMNVRTDAEFDIHQNNLWLNRLNVLDHFAQAARKVILQRRLLKRLKSIQALIESWREQKSKSKDYHTVDVHDYSIDYLKLLRGETLESDPIILSVQTSPMGTFHLPRTDEDEPDKTNSIDTIGQVNAPVLSFKNRYVLLSMPLTVPKQYILNGYKSYDPSLYRQDYVTFKLARSLRTGAEDELIKLDDSETVKIDKNEQKTEKLYDGTKTTIADPKLSKALIKSPIYHPLTVFNPAPGVMAYETPLPYSGIDVDSSVCPLPLLERPGYSTTSRYLDREDVIQGVMQWKKFNSTGLSALSQAPTMSNVWVPRWNDPFLHDILPTNVPPLLREMPIEDRAQVLEDEINESKIILTPEMLRAEFIESHLEGSGKANDIFPYGDKLPETNVPLSAHGLESRAQREQELGYFQRKKFGELTEKVNRRLEKYHSIARDDTNIPVVES
ncbi:unnamed protein product [Didymodactylos carnosus]|uniref:Primary ciliary dyskinesia protein 1 n=1 Tax=Didymodactylos carnosus TaxID=1234261 RepID=A0A8S2CYS4_9BILA|nr:unnamed protein product [Didymodactylos carnosus]CAF3538318.1 unnamed protein product [Didymodactylos carnosus]